MTELLTRTSATRADARGGTAASADGPPLWWRGMLGALWAVCLGLAVLVVLVLIVWATDSRSGSGAGEAMRAALQLWLAAHKVPLHVAGGHGLAAGTVAIAPLGLTVGFGALVARAAAVLTRGADVTDRRGVGRVTVAIGAPYGVLAAFVAAAAHGPAVRPSPIVALFAGLAVGLVAAAWGSARAAGRQGEVADLMPVELRRALSAGAAAVPVLLGAGLLLVLGSLAVHAHTASALADQLGGGAIAVIGLLLLDAVLLPNAAVAAIGYVTGPGFALGTGTSYAQTGVTSTALPSLPLLAAAPEGAAPLAVRLVCLLAIVGAGVLVGWRVLGNRPTGWLAVRAVVSAAGVSGVLVAVAVAVAGGPGGPGRMSAVGASFWQVGLATAGEVAAVAAVVVALGSRFDVRSWWRRS